MAIESSDLFVSRARRGASKLRFNLLRGLGTSRQQLVHQATPNLGLVKEGAVSLVALSGPHQMSDIRSAIRDKADIICLG
jgi:hypothetical protein